MRTAEITRTTKETDIRISLCLDGSGKTEIQTGVGFFDHMLTALAMHAGFDMAVSCKGDLQVDCHHTVEDVGIVLGQVFLQAIGTRDGIARYGHAVIPMDEALAEASIDIGGRAYLVCNAVFSQQMIGGFDTQMLPEFWRAFCCAAGVTLHLNLRYGANDHHKAEAVFKAFAKAMKDAVKIEHDQIPSTKGVL